MSKDIADTLRRAKAKIATPETWTRKVFARAPSGEPVNSKSDGASCWCSYGAIEAVANNFAAEDAAVGALKDQVEHRRVAQFNDDPTTTHADVLALFDRAIAAEESAP